MAQVTSFAMFDEITRRNSGLYLMADTDQPTRYSKQSIEWKHTSIGDGTTEACVGSVFPIPCMSLQVTNLIKRLLTLSFAGTL